MNKFRIVCILLLITNVTSKIRTYDDFINVLYDKLLLVIEGMSAEGQYKCYNSFKENKVIFSNMLKDIFNSTDFDDAINIIIKDCLEIDPILLLDIYANCHIDKLLTFITNYKIKEERIKIIKRIGNNIENNAEEFQKGSNGVVRKKAINDKIRHVGKIISAIFNIKFS